MVSNIYSYFYPKLHDHLKCRTCNATIKFNGTSPLISHLKTAHKQLHNAFSNGMSFTPTETTANKGIRFFQAECFAMNSIPFRVAESQSYRNLIDAASGGSKVDHVSAKTVKADISKMADDIRLEIIDELKNKKDLTIITDGYSIEGSPISYYSIFAVYRENCELKHRLIGIFPVEDSSTLKLMDEFRMFLDTFSMSLNQFTFMVSDSGANLLSLAKHASFYQVHCSCHSIHNGVTEEINRGIIGGIITKCKKIAGLICRSSKIRKEFDKRRTSTKPIPQNVCKTRWNGAYLLLLAIMEHIGAIASCITLNNHALSGNDQSIIAGILLVLEPVLWLSNKLEGNAALASDILPNFLLLVTKIESISFDGDEFDSVKSTLESFRTRLLKNLKRRFAKYQKSRVISMINLMDPRYAFWAPILPDGKTWDDIEKLFISTCKKKFERLLPTESEEDMCKPKPAKRTKSSDELDELIGSSMDSDVGSKEDTITNELKTYKQLITSQRPKSKVNPMSIWTIHKDSMPNLYRIASVFLCVNSSSAVTERIFSALSNILRNPRRRRMTPKTVADLLLVQSHISFKTNGSQSFGQYDMVNVYDSDDSGGEDEDNVNHITNEATATANEEDEGTEPIDELSNTGEESEDETEENL